MAKLKVGDKAPDFKLLDQNEEVVSLKDLKGYPVVVYFYPKANTSGCTTQSCALRDAMPQFDKLDTTILGISPDSPDAQRKFDEKYKFGFQLLADEDHKVATAWGTWGKKSMYGKAFNGIIRSAFVIDAKGKLAGVFYKISPTDTVPKVSEILKTL